MNDTTNKDIIKAVIRLQDASISSDNPLNGDSQNKVFELPEDNNTRFYEDDLFYSFYAQNNKED